MAHHVGGPLTEADYGKINTQLAALENHLREIETAKAAGFECAAEDQMCRDLQQRLAKVKAVYFPMKP